VTHPTDRERFKRRPDYTRRALFVHGIASPRYGHSAIRALCIEFLDIEGIARMTDDELISLPGIGPKTCRGIRALLDTYANAGKEKPPGTSRG
jgi:hypothetical protein